MSTKLNNGIKFKSRDMHEVLNQLISLREKALENSMNVLRGRCFKDCCRLIQDAKLNVEFEDFFSDGISENEDLIYGIADDFSYWNSSDCPDSVAEEEWLTRADARKNMGGDF